MKTTRRKFTSKFKAQVAIEAIKECEGTTGHSETILSSSGTNYSLET